MLRALRKGLRGAEALVRKPRTIRRVLRTAFPGLRRFVPELRNNSPGYSG
jgi:hypothetical protein